MDPLESVSDEELCALALAADPDVAADRDAISLWDLPSGRAKSSLPDWYMPSPMGGMRPLRGWRRWVISPIIISFLTITALGLCNTYGQLHF
jgi:hypothetical protein